MGDLEAQLAALRQEYLAELPRVAQQLRTAMAVRDDQAVFKRVSNEVHKLAGNAAAFEQMDIARLASELDVAFDQMQQAQTLNIDSQAPLLQRLIDLLDQAAI